jgi:hypothetical protein
LPVFAYWFHTATAEPSDAVTTSRTEALASVTGVAVAAQGATGAAAADPAARTGSRVPPVRASVTEVIANAVRRRERAYLPTCSSLPTERYTLSAQVCGLYQRFYLWKREGPSLDDFRIHGNPQLTPMLLTDLLPTVPA